VEVIARILQRTMESISCPRSAAIFCVGSDPSPDDVRNGSTYVFSLLKISQDGDVNVKSLGRPLNEPGYNGDLFIAPDEAT
jgi:hypothetical protein